MKQGFKKLIRALGFDIYRYPEACERVMPHLKQLVTKYNLDTAIDVGANEGQFASELRALCASMTIYSFEPNPKAYARMRAAATGDPAWKTRQLGLGSESGKMSLNVFSSDDFSSFLEPSAFGSKRFENDFRGPKPVEVSVVTMDELARTDPTFQLGQSVLLKLDTQGFDLEVLKGTNQCLEKIRVILTECSLKAIYRDAPDFFTMSQYLELRGYKISGFFPVSRASNFEIIEADCVFVRE